MSDFAPKTFLPASAMDRLTELRVGDPDRVLRAALQRRRRLALTRDGRLNLLAADHPARRVTRVGDDPNAMADRHDYLARIVRVLAGGAVDGVMATMDVLEDLLLLDDLVRERGGPPFLDDVLLIASLNRGGLAETAWELDDPLTGANPDGLRQLGLDGAKLLWRLADADPGSLRTMLACAQAITRLNRHHLPTFLEPLPVARGADGSLHVVKEAGALARIAGVAAALGDSSRLLWLKLPYCEGYERVARATTLPILLLGGEAVGDARPLLRAVAAGLAAGANVRGAMVGRNVLYPGAVDPLVAAGAVNALIHGGRSLEQAVASLETERGADLDALSRWLG